MPPTCCYRSECQRQGVMALVRRQGLGIVAQHDLLATLRRRELDAVGASLFNETNHPNPE
jgi:hypothetical protein